MKKFTLGERNKTTAHNRCSRCDHEWFDRPVGFARHFECPKCGSLYWVWLDYERAARR